MGLRYFFLLDGFAMLPLNDHIKSSVAIAKMLALLASTAMPNGYIKHQVHKHCSVLLAIIKQTLGLQHSHLMVASCITYHGDCSFPSATNKLTMWLQYSHSIAAIRMSIIINAHFHYSSTNQPCSWRISREEMSRFPQQTLILHSNTPAVVDQLFSLLLNAVN